MTISVLGSQRISGVPQTMMSARSQVRWAALKGIFLGHPPLLVERTPIDGHVGQVGRRRICCPGDGAPSGLPLVGLHPDQGVDQVRCLPPPGAIPFDDQQRAVDRNLDRSLPAVLVPSRRPVTDRLAVAHRDKDSVDQQVGPARSPGSRTVDRLWPPPSSLLLFYGTSPVTTGARTGLISPQPS